MSSSLLRNRSIRAALFASLLVSPALAATCRFVGGPQFGGIEPPLAVDADCIDPDYNDNTFAVDSKQQQTVKLPDGSSVAYTEVRGHFPPTRTPAQLPSGISQSPTTASHSVIWRFPDKAH